MRNNWLLLRVVDETVYRETSQDARSVDVHSHKGRSSLEVTIIDPLFESLIIINSIDGSEYEE